MDSQNKPDPIFVAGHPAIDFLNSRAVPVDVVVEWIGGGADLVAWLVAAGLIGEREANECKRRFDAGAMNDVATEARKLREWLRAFVSERAGRPIAQKLSEKDLRSINRLLAEGESFSRLEKEEGASSVPSVLKCRRWTAARQLLQPIADAIADLFARVDFRLIRVCGGKGCTLMFLDTTKSHQRRWCSMAICGNRAKAAMHRERAKGK